MILSAMVRTPRLATHVLEAGGGQPVVFIHGNLSDADVWHEQLELLPDGFRGVALDLRGYGRSERKPVDATLGVADFTEDVRALVGTLDLGPVHLVAHSMGAAVAYQYTIDHPDDVRTITVVAPMSPYGIGGTRGNGQPCRADFAGSGGGWNNPDFVRLLATGDGSTDHPASPRNVIRSLFFPQAADVRDEETILASMLRTEVGDDYYPGEGAPSEHWPGVAPGQRGVLNAISPRYLDLSGFARSGATAPVLWVRGGKDAVIADRSTIDLGTLGALG
ncbi:MAG TPA: alpha/beta hydrolase, partial [Egibacteraceae bacterium]|nr:alpha/beta hydrolase [Egibacteraceae bacterium]